MTKRNTRHDTPELLGSVLSRVLRDALGHDDQKAEPDPQPDPKARRVDPQDRRRK